MDVMSGDRSIMKAQRNIFEMQQGKLTVEGTNSFALAEGTNSFAVA